MSNGALPRQAELRQWSEREIDAEGNVGLDKMPRLATAVVDAAGPATAVLKCSKDQQGRYLVRTRVEMNVLMTCQRCLEPCDVLLGTDSVLACVWDDVTTGELPAEYDPLVTGDVTDLHELIEDELLLAVPAVAMHSTEECQALSVKTTDDVIGEEVETTTRPFAGLSELLGSSDTN